MLRNASQLLTHVIFDLHPPPDQFKYKASQIKYTIIVARFGNDYPSIKMSACSVEQ
jgi:hypothetical protein